MTGGQDHPGTGETLGGQTGRRLDFVALCKAIGIPHVEVLNPRDLDAMRKSIKAAVARDEPSVLIASHPCVLLTRQRDNVFRLDEASCSQCGACLRLGCPALSARHSVDEKGKDKQQPSIDPKLCFGCKLCVQVCPVDAISPIGEAR